MWCPGNSYALIGLKLARGEAGARECIPPVILDRPSHKTPGQFERNPAVGTAILAAVEDGILSSGMVPLNAELTPKPARQSAGQNARL